MASNGLPTSKKKKMIDVDFTIVRELATLLNETGLTEIEIGEGPTRIRVARNITNSAPLTPYIDTDHAATQGKTAVDEVIPTAQHPGAIVSPLVGVVYHAPEPGAEPFITKGDTVTEGQTILIIEAMKTMNPIRAPRNGTVIDILVSNSAPVEYGEVLLVIE